MFKKTLLSNGLRIVTVPQPENMATTVLVMVEAGSKYEQKEINGLSHFLEHMCFKGTTNRPNSMLISGELDGLGAHYNAFTSHEWTGYFAKVEKQHAEQAIDLISDLYLNPVFDKAEIEKEKGVIIEELNMYEDMPQRKIGDIFLHLLYGDQPAGWDVGGEKDIIRILTKEDFVAYRAKHYLPQATTVVVAGAFDEQAVLGQLEKLFGKMPVGEKGDKLKVIEKQSKPEIFIKHKESDQTHLMIGFRAFSMFDERRYALEVLADILGGGMSSRLFHKVREELGAAYYVNAGADLYTDHGYISAGAGVEHSKLEIVIKAILAEFKRLVDEPVSAEELKRAKSHLSGTTVLGLETSDSLAIFYGVSEVLRKNPVPPADLLKKIDAVTAEQIQALAKELFKPETLNLAMIGPKKDEGEIRSLLQF
jgi:predicted Zn-dependent peptidase